MRNITLRQMRVFAAVARNLSFTRAARELHLTQPAVSQQMKLLEEEVGMPLFEQIGRKRAPGTRGCGVAALHRAGHGVAAAGGRVAGRHARPEAWSVEVRSGEHREILRAVAVVGVHARPTRK